MLESRWLILALLFIARFALGYQFQSAGSVAPFIKPDLHIDYAQVGLLIGAFLFPGLAISVPSGFVIRRFGDKNIVVVGMVLMIAGGVLMGLGQTYGVLLVGRLLSGTGGTIVIVVTLKMIIDWFAEKELFLGMAVFIIGFPIGIAAAQATQSRWAEMYGWPSVFFGSAALVAVPLLLMLAFYRRPPEVAAPMESERRRLTRPEVAMTCLTGAIWMFLNAAYLVMLSFGPSELNARGMSIPAADTVVSVISWVFIIALPLGGHLATRYKAPNAVMVGGLVASIVVGAHLPFSPAPLLSFTLFGIALALATPVVAALPASVLPPAQRAPGFGIYYLWYFGGMTILIAVAGLLRDGTGSATASLEFAVAMLVACVILLGVFRFKQARQT
jgi:predicted MFS family arabinose efflux permease